MRSNPEWLNFLMYFGNHLVIAEPSKEVTYKADVFTNFPKWSFETLSKEVLDTAQSLDELRKGEAPFTLRNEGK